ncbi:MAG: NusA-like transcription termination signal-binding factor [Halobacteria archaeon]
MPESGSPDRMRYISLIERMTEATVVDCLVEEEFGRIVYVVRKGEMGKAIGKGGANISRLKKSIEKEIEIIEYSEDPEEFIENAFQPAKIDEVEVQDEDDRKIAEVDVDDGDKGLAIGKSGRNIGKVQKLSGKHFDVDDVVLE